MRVRLKVLFSFLFNFSMPVLASEAIPGIPNFHSEYPALSVQQYLLGPVCLTLSGSPLELSCNPAFLASEEKHQVRINLATNDRISQVNDYRIKLTAGDSAGIVNKSLTQTDPITARAAAGVWYQREFWAVGYIPFRGGFASMVRNQAYPRISAHIFKESEIFAKAGLLASGDKNFQIGLQLRFVDRQFFRRQFDLLDALGDPNQLQIETQKVLYAEPGLSYSFDSSWSSAVSAVLTQVPVFQQGYHNQFSPVLDLGFSTSPPFAGRKLRTSTHYNSGPDRPDLLARFLWGAVYDFEDDLSITLSLGKTIAGFGINGHYDSLTLGAGWKTEDFSPDQWQSVRVSTYLFEVGLVF